jgi:hypothetical protein
MNGDATTLGVATPKGEEVPKLMTYFKEKEEVENDQTDEVSPFVKEFVKKKEIIRSSKFISGFPSSND